MFSVVIPIYNHARYLRTAVQSCLNSPLVKEILLVDDGSTDDSARVARELAVAHLGSIRDLTEVPTANRGAHARLNQLCAVASQPWIAVLNSDDFFPAQRLDVAALLIETTGCDFIAGAIWIVDDSDRIIGTKRGISEPEYPCPQAAGLDASLATEELRLLLCSQNFIATTSNMLFRKSLFEKVGGFADLRYSHDWDFALRATMFGRCVWTPHFLTCYRLHTANTIREQSPHMDGEIVRFFYRFLADYPHLEADANIRQALSSNQHLAPYTPPIPESYSISSSTSEIGEGYYFPADFHKRSLLNAYLGIYYFSYDFLLISSSLEELPAIHASSVAHALVYKSTLNFPSGSAPNTPLRGRLIRTPVAESAGARLADIRKLPGWDGVRFQGADLYFGEPPPQPQTRQTSSLKVLKTLLEHRDYRPTCLVLPIFMAVGGVERNTIETIRELRNDYRFIVVTTERLTETQGSLHAQLDDLDIPVFDLAEIGAAEHHLALLAALAHVTAPKLVWICNGSRWLADHAISLRRLFAHIPIIDQQVYDTEFGWINTYNQKGIQSFDRFIAVNHHIYDKFIAQLRIPRHRVELIYPAINGKRVAEELLANSLPSSVAHYLDGRCERGRLLIFVGRLTAQKRPLAFLQLAAMAARNQLADHFIIIGNGELRHDCESFIADNGLRNVTPIPYHPNPAQLLRIADGMIITSIHEGLPVAMLEALAVGCPVLSTDVGDIGLILGQYKSGRTISGNSNSEEFWTAFLDWRSDLDALRAEAQKQRHAVSKRFAMTTIASEYRKCFALATASARTAASL